MTRYLVTGAGGMLGADVCDALAGREVTALTRDDLDITDADQVASAVEGQDVVINTAAYTAVDAAEGDEDTAYRVNAIGPAHLVAAAARSGARVVQLSTDYVFRGDASSPYEEDAPRDPLGAYGRTKAAGEEAVLAYPLHYLVRTAWLYGRHGSNFPKTILRLATERQEISVVDDQIGQPTWSRDVAATIVLLLDARAPFGTYHATNSGQASWFDLAREIFRLAGLDTERVRPTDSASFVRPAPRPTFSVLGHAAWTRAGLATPRPWQDALADAFAEGALTG